MNINSNDFILEDLLADEWSKLSNGQKKGLGRIFKKKVNNKEISEIEWIGKDSRNHNHYKISGVEYSEEDLQKIVDNLMIPISLSLHYQWARLLGF